MTLNVSSSPYLKILKQNDELVAVEDSIDVGNVLYILYGHL